MVLAVILASAAGIAAIDQIIKYFIVEYLAPVHTVSVIDNLLSLVYVENRTKTFNEQMEIANLTGNISQKDGQVYLHLHAIFGRRDYTCVGGHLLEASLNGACELVVERFDGAPAPGRYVDPETGLNLYEF